MTNKDKKHIRIWYWSGALMVLIILVIGGITRLTQSGLSMVEWNPIMGVIPPLSEADWNETFEKYKEFPEYQQRNRGMSLAEFRFIFFWEYLHRMAGRLIGLVFLIPFGWFVIRKKFSRKQLKRALILLILGLSQGFLGWYMVQSGLIDVPWVSPYRLAGHLLMAFAIFGCCVWFALDLKPDQPPASEPEQTGPSDRNLTKTARLPGIADPGSSAIGASSGETADESNSGTSAGETSPGEPQYAANPGLSGYGAGSPSNSKLLHHLRWWLIAFMVVLLLQIVWGAFVAGMHAGHIYNTFPKMNQFWIPPEAWLLEPFIQNLFENPAAVQWIHRLLGTLLLVMVIYIWARVMFSSVDHTLKWWGVALLGIVLLQYLLGVFTLLYHVPISLGVIHQAAAMLLFGVVIGFYHTVTREVRNFSQTSGVSPAVEGVNEH